MFFQPLILSSESSFGFNDKESCPFEVALLLYMLFLKFYSNDSYDNRAYL